MMIACLRQFDRYGYNCRTMTHRPAHALKLNVRIAVCRKLFHRLLTMTCAPLASVHSDPRGRPKTSAAAEQPELSDKESITDSRRCLKAIEDNCTSSIVHRDGGSPIGRALWLKLKMDRCVGQCSIYDISLYSLILYVLDIFLFNLSLCSRSPNPCTRVTQT